MAAFLDVDLEQVAEIVQAGAPLPEPALLLHARRLRISLRHDEPSKLVAELTGDLLPHRMAEKIAEADSAIVNGIGKEYAPPILRQLDVFEVGPTFRVDADGRPHVDLVIVLKALRPHLPPPLDVLRLPVLERPLQTFVARQVDVIRDSFGG